MTEQKKLLLIFPPLSVPTSPPLGMAMLKSYIERRLGDWNVRALDLNLWSFDLIVDLLRRGEIGVTDDAYRRIGTNVAGVLEAVEIFRGRDAGLVLYSDGKAYDWAARAMLELMSIFSEVLIQDSAMWEQTGRASPLLTAMADRILQEKPAVLGISALFTHQLSLGAMLGRLFRQRYGIPVIFGGGCFTEGVEDFINAYPEAADAVVSGDGEDALKTLLQNGINPRGVPGVFYRCGGKVMSTPAIYKTEIDAFGMPDFGDYDFAAYYSPKPVVPLLLSRGCYWRKCTFCVHYFSAGDSYRVRSIQQVVDMLCRVREQGIQHFSFVDEMIPPGYFSQLADAIQYAGLDIAYYALSKPNRTFSRSILNSMARSGCRYVLWGVESGNRRVLDLMGKGTNPEDIASVLCNAHNAGINNHVYVICGFPTETRTEFGETLAFLESNKPYIQATHRSLFSLEVGSPISKDLARFGITNIWVAKQTALGARLGYQTVSGMSMDEAHAAFQEALPFLRNFSSHAQSLDYFRDHALLVYDHWVRQAVR